MAAATVQDLVATIQSGGSANVVRVFFGPSDYAIQVMTAGPKKVKVGPLLFPDDGESVGSLLDRLIACGNVSNLS